MPTLVADTVNQIQGHPLLVLGSGRAKKIINNEVIVQMSPELLAATDPNNEIIGWLSQISQRLN